MTTWFRTTAGAALGVGLVAILLLLAPAFSGAPAPAAMERAAAQEAPSVPLTAAASPTERDVADAMLAHFRFMTGKESIDAWTDWWARDAVAEFPYQPSAGFRGRVEGRAAIREYFRGSFDYLDFDEFTDLRVHAAERPGLAFVEFKGRGTVVSNGRDYRQTYFGLVRLEGGRIAYFREINDPVVIVEAFGGSVTRP